MRSGRTGKAGGDGNLRGIPDVLATIKDSYSELRPAERRVADVVLDDVALAVDASNAEIARRANVSEPTVTRFCRAIGCEGVRDFKLKLARSLVVGQLYLGPAESKPVADGSPLWSVVLAEAHNALNAVERSIDPQSVLDAADLIAGAGQVLVFGLGGSSTALAQEMQNRLFRYGVRAVAHADIYMLRMTAATLKPNDVVIAISGTGRTHETIEVVELAKYYRAKAICITAPDTKLAALADTALSVSVPEHPDPLKPTASRYAFLAVIDLVSAAVGYRLDKEARETLRRIKHTVLSHRNGSVLEPLGD
ncbi:MAG: MurR/RpiR family transcriptional regulator [Devosia sp.]|nr:MurR/RpiR family transcriptional regulator [Devosia sp.]